MPSFKLKFSKSSFCNNYLAYKKGIIFIENIPSKLSFSFLNFFSAFFGKINRFFFLPQIHGKKIIGWIEFSRKTQAKKVDQFFKESTTFSLPPWNLVKVRYMKSFGWDKIVLLTKKKNCINKAPAAH